MVSSIATLTPRIMTVSKLCSSYVVRERRTTLILTKHHQCKVRVSATNAHYPVDLIQAVGSRWRGSAGECNNSTHFGLPLRRGTDVTLIDPTDTTRTPRQGEPTRVRKKFQETTRFDMYYECLSTVDQMVRHLRKCSVLSAQLTDKTVTGHG